jgi:hypothetical protein
MFVLSYLDAGSGSLLLQLLVGGVAGAAAFVRFKWGRWRGRGVEATNADDIDRQSLSGNP